MKKWIQNLLFTFIVRYLPNKGKRMFYILICYLAWSKTKDANVVRNELIEINNAIRMCENTEALNFVIALKDILMDMEDVKNLNDIDRTTFQNNPLRYIPMWVRYDDDDNILLDLKHVLKPKYIHLASTQNTAIG